MGRKKNALVLSLAMLVSTVLFTLVPSDVTRADSNSVDITVDTAFIRSVLDDTTSSGYDVTTDYCHGQYSLATVESHVGVVLNGNPISSYIFSYDLGPDGVPEHRLIQIIYATEDLSLFEAGSSVNVTINGAPLYCSKEDYYGNWYTLNGVSGVTVNFSRYTSYGIVLSFNASFLDTVEMYRLYNPNSGEHFYTANPDEQGMLINLGWRDEGTGWIAPNMSNTPVYRLYNPNAGEHHYTTDAGERDSLVAVGWNDEGIGWYSYEGFGWYADGDRMLPLQRYTTDEYERAILMSAGWRDAGNGWLSGAAVEAPLYRQYNPNEFANNHNYTTSLDENNWLVSLGWRAEGTGWYGVG